MRIGRLQIEISIAALESQRELLGDDIVDAALLPLRAKLIGLGGGTADDESPDQALKQVTILFLDAVGSTALGQGLDPEEVSAVMDGLLRRATGIVEFHGGRVLQYAGDNLLAAFGADEVREDDPERAVRAGLELLVEGRRQGKLVAKEHGYQGFDVRIGVHTGVVLLGGGVDAEGSIRGQAVNIAARMEQTAPPGSLRISHDTYQHVRGVFDVDPQPPLAIKGLEQPISTYLVKTTKPRAFRVASRGIEGIETRMIGRDAELNQLQHAFQRLFEIRRWAAVTVVAEAGLGKSRLLDEFRKWAESGAERFKGFQGRATPQTLVRAQVGEPRIGRGCVARCSPFVIPARRHRDGRFHRILRSHLARIGIESVQLRDTVSTYSSLSFRLTVRTPDRAIIAIRPINRAPVPAAIRITLMGSSLVYATTAVVARSRTCSAAD